MAGSSSKYFIEDFEHKDSVRLCKISFHILSASCEAVSLACLVEAEIVSPYSGILINTGVGNPTATLITVLGDKQVLRGWWGHVVASTHIRG